MLHFHRIFHFFSFLNWITEDFFCWCLCKGLNLWWVIWRRKEDNYILFAGIKSLKLDKLDSYLQLDHNTGSTMSTFVVSSGYNRTVLNCTSSTLAWTGGENNRNTCCTVGREAATTWQEGHWFTWLQLEWTNHCIFVFCSWPVFV